MSLDVNKANELLNSMRKEKTIVIGDIHGRTYWRYIIEKEKPTRVIFVGDYFDSFDITGLEQLHNFNRIIKYKEEHPEIEIILLIGNHDHHYFPEIGNSGTSGYQSTMAIDISYALNQARNHLRMAYHFTTPSNSVIVSHAGIGETWLQRVGATPEIMEDPDQIVSWVNGIWAHKPKEFTFGAKIDSERMLNPNGDSIGQSPIWIRPKSLMADNALNFKNRFIQVVGHTGQLQIDIKGKSTGGRYYFIDTLGTSREYLIFEDDEIKAGKFFS